jgi:hypothetical protein
MRTIAILSLLALVAGCNRREPAAEARLAEALDSLQQGRLDDAGRSLAAIRGGGGWLRPATWTAPLACRLRAQIALKQGAVDETTRLLTEYTSRYGGMAAGAYARVRLDFLAKYRDWQAVPALAYLRGLEAESDTPALALREWRTLLRDYPHAAITPSAQLKLGLLQFKLENPTWALSDLAAVSTLPADVVDPDGNAVAPQALLAMGRLDRDQRQDLAGARAAFEAVIAQYGTVTLKTRAGGLAWSPAAMATWELAAMAPDGGMELLDRLTSWNSAPGYVTDELTGQVRAQARLKLAEIDIRRRNWDKARDRLLEVEKQAADVAMGPPDGPARWYGYEAIDWMAGRLGAKAPDAGVKALEDAAAQSRRKELWAYARLMELRLLARLGRLKEAKAIAAELESRAASLECDPYGDGLWLVPAREARRLLGGAPPA